MKPSLKGGHLPESEADYKILTVHGGLKYNKCIQCTAPFSSANTHTAAGWRDTQIVGMCEDCYDNLFQEDALEASPL